MFVKRIVETQFELNCFLDKQDTELVFQTLLLVEESELETEFGIAYAGSSDIALRLIYLANRK